jgi:hypothetical protein
MVRYSKGQTVSESGSVSVLRRRGVKQLLYWVRQQEPISILHPLDARVPETMCCLEYRAMDKAQRPSNHNNLCSWLLS